MFYHKFQKCRKNLFLVMFICLLLFAGGLLYDSIPDELYVIKGEEDQIHFSVPVSFEKKEGSVTVFQNQTKTIDFTTKAKEYQLTCKFLGLIPVKEVSVYVVDRSYVMPSGVPIGIYTKTKGVLIIGTGKVTSENGLNYEPADELVQSGDYIITVNGVEISNKEDLIQMVNESEGNAIVLGILRDGESIKLKIEPIELEDGSYKLGIWVRDDMAGVGTLTYVKEDFEYGALGHPVSDADTGDTIPLATGELYNTDIVGIVKGEDGAPGELTGVINYNDKYCLGTILENSATGIYGKLERIPEEMEQTYTEVGMKQEIEKGEAYILSSLDGTMQMYQIEIDEINYNDKEKNKGILFHVTDERLLAKTGGIVQGMSGSPILQNGRIIGAVTHVFISDATKGYGIFMETMLK